jgi:hypothetical protein
VFAKTSLSYAFVNLKPIVPGGLNACPEARPHALVSLCFQVALHLDLLLNPAAGRTPLLKQCASLVALFGSPTSSFHAKQLSGLQYNSSTATTTQCQ